MAAPLELEQQTEEIKGRHGQVSEAFFATLFSLLLPLKNALAILIYNSFDLISSVNKLPACMSQTFSNVVSSVGGLSYSAISMEGTKLYWRLYWPSKSFCFGFREKTKRKPLARIDDVTDHISGHCKLSKQ